MVLNMNRDFRMGFVDRDSAQRFLESPSNWLYAAIYEKTIIGFAYGYVLNRLDTKSDMLYIHEVGVMEPYQRMGIGSSMMVALMRSYTESGISKVFLFTDQKNTGANRLYRKLGGTLSYDSNGKDTVYFFQTKA